MCVCVLFICCLLNCSIVCLCICLFTVESLDGNYSLLYLLAGVCPRGLVVYNYLSASWNICF